jgi:hypothetical protein
MLASLYRQKDTKSLHKEDECIIYCDPDLLTLYQEDSHRIYLELLFRKFVHNEVFVQ